jgi:hypothetical protein
LEKKIKSLHERICDLQREVPDTYKPFETKVIWTGHQMFYIKECDWQDWVDGDCRHPAGWHRIPYRVRTGEQGGYLFEVIRRRPDNEPGTDWTPMAPDEIEWIEQEWIADRLAQLTLRPDIEDTDD